MKITYLKNTVATAALVGVVAVFAGNASAQVQVVPQQTPVTRAEVNHQLVQLEAVGYQPGGNQNNYPNDVQAAEARVQAAQAERLSAGNYLVYPAGPQNSNE